MVKAPSFMPPSPCVRWVFDRPAASVSAPYAQARVATRCRSAPNFCRVVPSRDSSIFGGENSGFWIDLKVTDAAFAGADLAHLGADDLARITAGIANNDQAVV